MPGRLKRHWKCWVYRFQRREKQVTEYSICVVDDDQSLAKGIAKALKKNYQTAVSFTAGLEAINAQTGTPG